MSKVNNPTQTLADLKPRLGDRVKVETNLSGISEAVYRRRGIREGEGWMIVDCGYEIQSPENWPVVEYIKYVHPGSNDGQSDPVKVNNLHGMSVASIWADSPQEVFRLMANWMDENEEVAVSSLDLNFVEDSREWELVFLYA